MSSVHHGSCVNPYQQPLQPTGLAPALSLSGDCCCNGMHQSTCKMCKCHCVQAGIPCQPCHCSNKCCKHTTASKFTVSVCPTDELSPPTADDSQLLDHPAAGLTAAALPLAPTNPAAPPAPPPPESPAAPLPPGDLPGTPYRHWLALGYGLQWPCSCQSRHSPVRGYLQWPRMADLPATADCLPFPSIWPP